ncbi:MAG: GPW/gp25 family protein [Candidatus Shapirobacteria bacterium]
MAYAYQDIDLELSRQRDGDIKTLGDIEAVKASMMNIAKTMQGSRRMLPDFAYGVVYLLHELMSEDTARRLGEAILDALNTWEDRIDILNVNVHMAMEQATYNITVLYSLKSIGSIGETLTLNFILKRL